MQSDTKCQSIETWFFPLLCSQTSGQTLKKSTLILLKYHFFSSTWQLDMHGKLLTFRQRKSGGSKTNSTSHGLKIWTTKTQKWRQNANRVILTHLIKEEILRVLPFFFFFPLHSSFLKDSLKKEETANLKCW